MDPHIYFVSYSHCGPLGFGFGSTSVPYDRPVNRFADVEVLTQKVHERMTQAGYEGPLSSIVVMNYQLLSGPEGQ
ncbi:hypothetical protein AB0B63_07180 [Micromonospora sp. NPDC049081]|uniref:hypothetical protein n=1 Tax=Micromonospora sp. NPDC049081 TaxID=3155150 RepID=UPI0033FC8653